MTLRQVLDVLWQRRLLVVATLILVMLVAGAYMRYSVKTYSSTAVVKMNAIATASSDTSSPYAGMEVDTDLETIKSEQVLEPAARRLGDIDSASLGGAVTVEVVEGVRNNRIHISATGASPDQARQRANEVASTYVDYLSSQVDDGVKALKQRQAASAKRIRQLQAQIGPTNDKDPNDEDKDQVLETYLESETATLGQIKTQLDAITTAGKPAEISLRAMPGEATSVGPNTILGIGLLSGLLAGAGVALIREQFDQRLHSSADVEAATGEPILAEVAVVRGRRKHDMSLPTALHGATGFNESIRRLRTSLQVLIPQRSVIVMTSPDPGDGKSFIAANLAVSISLAGRSVIVVGGDLRRAQLGSYFGVTPDVRGFADAIEANLDDQALASLLRPTEHPGLMVLAAGQSKAEPADLLAANTLGFVIQRLRNMADVVLIDTPPALALADAAIIARHADGVVVLSTIGRTQRESLVSTLRVLRANGTNVLGVVCNRSRRSMPDTYREYLLPVAGWELPGTTLPRSGDESAAGDNTSLDQASVTAQALPAEDVGVEPLPGQAGGSHLAAADPARTANEIMPAGPARDTGEEAHDASSAAATEPTVKTRAVLADSDLDQIEASIRSWTFSSVLSAVTAGSDSSAREVKSDGPGSTDKDGDVGRPSLADGDPESATATQSPPTGSTGEQVEVDDPTVTVARPTEQKDPGTTADVSTADRSTNGHEPVDGDAPERAEERTASSS